MYYMILGIVWIVVLAVLLIFRKKIGNKLTSYIKNVSENTSEAEDNSFAESQAAPQGSAESVGTTPSVGTTQTAASKPKFVLEGYKGVLKVYENRVEINKSGSGFITGNSLKTLPMANIMSVSLTPSTTFARGFIEFTVPGGRDSKNVEEAMRNENALLLNASGQNEIAMKIKSYIEEQIMINASNKGGNTTIIQQNSSSADELVKYKNLLDSGIITQEEFDAKKKQLLGL